MWSILPLLPFRKWKIANFCLQHAPPVLMNTLSLCPRDGHWQQSPSSRVSAHPARILYMSRRINVCGAIFQIENSITHELYASNIKLDKASSFWCPRGDSVFGYISGIQFYSEDIYRGSSTCQNCSQLQQNKRSCKLCSCSEESIGQPVFPDLPLRYSTGSKYRDFRGKAALQNSSLKKKNQK